MAQQRKSGSSRSVKSEIFRNKGTYKFLQFLESPRAKIIFFSIYLAVTIFMFRDFIFSDSMLFGGDTIPDGVYTRKFYKEYHEEFGGVPRWNPYILGGLPFIDAMHGDTFYPGAWFKFFMPLERALGHKLVWHVLLAGFAMYILLRVLGHRRDVSFLGGLMYMLAPSFVSLVYPGHDAKMYIIAWLPLAFAALERGIKKPSLGIYTILGGLMGLLILTSHVQMAYYSYWALGLYFIFRLITAEDKKLPLTAQRGGLFVMAVVIALMLGAVQLFPSYKFSTSQSVRVGSARSTFEYATSWSMHQEEAAGMFVPSFQGISRVTPSGIDRYQYWGRNPFKLNSEYHGMLPMLLAILALFFVRKKRIWFFFGLAIFSLIYALGSHTPFYRLFYAFVPGVKSFRAPGMIIFLFAFSIVAMAADLLTAIIDGSSRVRTADKRLLYIAAGITFTAIVITAMGNSFFTAWAESFYSGMPERTMQTMLLNVPLFKSDMWRIVILACISLAGIWMYSAGKIKGMALLFLLAFVIIIDQSVVNSRFITTIDPLQYPGLAPDNSVRELQAKQKTEGHFRILDPIHGNNYYAMFGISQVGGAHNNELQSYEQFRLDGGNNLYRDWYDDYTFNPDGIPRNNFLRVAGVKYLTLPTTSAISLYENTGALPRAYIVDDYILVDDSSTAVGILAKSEFDPSKTALIEAEEGEIPFPPSRGSAGSSRVRNLEYQKFGPLLQCSFASPGLLVISDNYVPYWRAEIDGVETKIFRAYGTFMAIACPEGDHEIRFTFRSRPYEQGRGLTLMSLGLIVILLAVSYVFGSMKTKAKQAS